jgi:uncharacterized membrane protein
MNQTIEKGKPAAITAYILIVGVFIALSMNYENKNPFASFHIRQAFGLSVSFVLLGIVVSNFNDLAITFGMWGFVSVLWGFGIFSAIRGSVQPMPLLGSLFQKIFKSIG